MLNNFNSSYILFVSKLYEKIGNIYLVFICSLIMFECSYFWLTSHVKSREKPRTKGVGNHSNSEVSSLYDVVSFTMSSLCLSPYVPSPLALIQPHVARVPLLEEMLETA